MGVNCAVKSALWGTCGWAFFGTFLCRLVAGFGMVGFALGCLLPLPKFGFPSASRMRRDSDIDVCSFELSSVFESTVTVCFFLFFFPFWTSFLPVSSELLPTELEKHKVGRSEQTRSRKIPALALSAHRAQATMDLDFWQHFRRERLQRRGPKPLVCLTQEMMPCSNATCDATLGCILDSLPDRTPCWYPEADCANPTMCMSGHCICRGRLKEIGDASYFIIALVLFLLLLGLMFGCCCVVYLSVSYTKKKRKVG